MHTEIVAARPNVHVYHARMLSGRWRLFWQFIPLIYPVLIIINVAERNWFGVALWASLLALVPLSIHAITETRLVLSPRGIAYHTVAGTLSAAWQDVERFGSKPGWQYRGSQGLILRSATWKPSKRWGWLRPRPRDYIALTTWGGAYWEAGLSDELRWYIPSLWETGTEQGNTLPALDNEAWYDQKRFWLLFGAVLFGSILGGFLSVFLRNVVLGTVLTITFDVVLVLLVVRVTQRWR